jgi:hypothetical protein
MSSSRLVRWLLGTLIAATIFSSPSLVFPGSASENAAAGGQERRQRTANFATRFSGGLGRAEFEWAVSI